VTSLSYFYHQILRVNHFHYKHCQVLDESGPLHRIQGYHCTAYSVLGGYFSLFNRSSFFKTWNYHFSKFSSSFRDRIYFKMFSKSSITFILAYITMTMAAINPLTVTSVSPEQVSKNTTHIRYMSNKFDSHQLLYLHYQLLQPPFSMIRYIFPSPRKFKTILVNIQYSHKFWHRLLLFHLRARTYQQFIQ